MNNNENPVKIGKLRFDGDALYFRSGLKNVTLPYGELERAFLRVREATGKMCCGTACFADCYLVLVSAGQELAEIRMEKEDVEAVLSLIAERSPGTVIGKA